MVCPGDLPSREAREADCVADPDEDPPDLVPLRDDHPLVPPVGPAQTGKVRPGRGDCGLSISGRAGGWSAARSAGLPTPARLLGEGRDSRRALLPPVCPDRLAGQRLRGKVPVALFFELAPRFNAFGDVTQERAGRVADEHVRGLFRDQIRMLFRSCHARRSRRENASNIPTERPRHDGTPTSKCRPREHPASGPTSRICDGQREQ